ncbi:MAK10-like protein [Tanacetum coccineum]
MPPARLEPTTSRLVGNIHTTRPKVLGKMQWQGLADGTKSYSIGIVRSVEVYVGKLKLLKYFYVIDMEKDPTYPLLVGRGFLATASAVIDCKKSKIAVGEGITRSIFGVREGGYNHEDTPYRTTIERQKFYDP